MRGSDSKPRDRCPRVSARQSPPSPRSSLDRRRLNPDFIETPQAVNRHGYQPAHDEEPDDSVAQSPEVAAQAGDGAPESTRKAEVLVSHPECLAPTHPQPPPPQGQPDTIVQIDLPTL